MLGVLNMMNTFSRLSVHSIVNQCNISTCMYPLYFRATDALLGEPLKKKKRLDPAIIRAREERKRRKLMKQIRRGEKHAKQLKPIVENEITADFLEEKDKLIRPPTPLSVEEIERRAILQKEWTRFKKREWINDVRVMESIVNSQEKALAELKAASEELYAKAIEIDDSFVPYSAVGPVHTPPIKNYDSPDGSYADITMVYDGEK
ncbi:39S ribosomal protein L40, mitochondrial [Hylaeus anthracinus]|uniref:39S ribosomal protein L40, mitochondrial n=1 Tax=Hylaeus anthracinus TaxID=313031 RepID=UPI0023B95819|nr:39S ribosomal protein L40, mitochondrial [Hylaeus anthracinus]XP_054011609.1 39S ribosomal protein L40, mitochondrial [Hylaeus anthracinus]XP_054011610.1 39S ribosomal protein L40, mitochondrial [Hylaeus anthracinus]